MSKLSGLLGLPDTSLNSLCIGIAAIGIGFSFRIALAPNLALRWANMQIITSSSADKLDDLAVELDEMAEVIKQKDKAYNELKAIYNSYLANETGGIELDDAFNVIKDLPEVEDTEEIQAEIEEIEEELSEVTIE